MAPIGARPRPLAASIAGRIPVLLAALSVAFGVLVGPAADGPAAALAARDDARILVGEPATLDPAAAGDSSSAAVIAQLFETVTAHDPALVLRPALAESWTTEDGGRRVVFSLRPGLAFSDGSSLTAADVVRSWLRVIDPERPSPLASLLDDVEGAAAYRRGETDDPGSVGIAADGDRQVIVDLRRPVSDFPSIVASPTFGIVPPGFPGSADGGRAGDVVSGGYRVDRSAEDGLTLVANERYWAGRPAIGTIHLVTDLGGRSPVEAFEDGQLDYAPISTYDASWIAYDAELGPALRDVPSLDLTYIGFDTTEPPYDDPRVRLAIATAVDWRRIVELGGGERAEPATSMVPPGVPGRSERDFIPDFDPAAARALLAEAGFADPADFPPLTIVTPGTGFDGAIVDQLRTNLGIDVRYEVRSFADHYDQLDRDPPAMFAVGWIADYPGRNATLGFLLETGSTSNYPRWSSDAFDAAIEAALGAADPAEAAAAFDTAEDVIAREAPVVPIEYSPGFALARDGLLGAGQNGLGALRMAGMAWAPRAPR
jgi:oligopeptide transport system substrate-binding protein